MLCKYNKFANLLKAEKEQSNDLYPWLEKDAPRRNMTDREILEKTVSLEHLHLQEIREQISIIWMLLVWK